MAQYDHYKKGLFFEFLARLYLRFKGYSILEKRYRCLYGEIDIIAKRGKKIIALEVKYRASKHAALNSVSFHQKKRILKSLETFLAFYSKPYNHVDIDVMCFYLIGFIYVSKAF